MVTERVYVVHIFGLAQMQRNCNNNDLSIKKFITPSLMEEVQLLPLRQKNLDTPYE